MKKLSKAQKETLEYIIREINDIRRFKTVDEYLEYGYKKAVETTWFYKDYTFEMWLNFKSIGDTTNKELYTDWYNERYNGKMVTHGVNKRTLAKLQDFGYIDTLEEWCDNNEEIQVNLEACGIK